MFASFGCVKAIGDPSADSGTGPSPNADEPGEEIHGHSKCDDGDAIHRQGFAEVELFCLDARSMSAHLGILIQTCL